jgi:CHAD domain-containing protein
VKLPAGGGARREVHAPLGSVDEGVPADIRRRIEVVLRGRPVHPVLVLETTRTATTLLDPDGVPLAELADDEVTATNPDTAAIRAWREWEVELAPGVDRADGEALLDEVGGVLEASGASISASKSKLARGLGAVPGLAGAVPADAEDPLDPDDGTAGAFVVGTIGTLVARLVRLDPAARDDDDDAVHRFRTTIRRLRSVLRVYRGVVDSETVSALDERLAAVGAAAGAVRDAEVAEQQLAIDLADSPEGFVSHDTAGRIRAQFREQAVEARYRLAVVMTDASYFELLDLLESLPREAPDGPSAGKGAAKFAAARIAKESKRARRRAADAAALDTFDLEPVHRARKAGRRLRYAIEAQRAAGLKGGVSPKAAHAIQRTLGEALDAAAATERYRSVADTARWAEEDTFGYGVLATVALARRDAAVARLPKLAEKL